MAIPRPHVHPAFIRILFGALLAFGPLYGGKQTVRAQTDAPTFTADPPTVIFVNELHYDNASTDADEGVEIAAPAGTDVSNLRLILYRDDGTEYGAYELGAPVAQCNDYDLYTVMRSGIQNGPADGLALVDVAANEALQLLSYEGTFTANEGIAAGLTSTDIGVEEPTTTPVGHSLQLSGEGGAYDDFAWQEPASATFGACNNNQTLGAPPTRVTLRSFTATAAGDSVTLTWETAMEIDNAGFHLYRAGEAEGDRVRINQELIGATAAPGQGATYTYRDEPGTGQFFYWLEDVDTQGSGTLHGPVAVTVNAAAGEGGQDRTFLPVVAK